MKRFERTVSVVVVEWNELSQGQQELVGQAIFARMQAQCPYSGFAVGAAARTANGDICVGQNVENVNWTATTHAEQSALTATITSSGPGAKIVEVAVVGALREVSISGPLDAWGKSPSSMDEISGPCGHCRQIIWENADGDKGVSILLFLPSGEVAITTMGDLFPMAFGPQDIGK